MRQRGFIHVYTQIALLTVAGAIFVSFMTAVTYVLLLGIAVF